MTEYKYKVVDGAGGSCAVHPRSSFYREYKKGTVVKAPKGSLGIMLFQDKKSAMSFLSISQSYDSAKRMVKRVIPTGEPVFPKEVVWAICDSNLERFTKYMAGKPDVNLVRIKPPKGTICYPEVLVVD